MRQELLDLVARRLRARAKMLESDTLELLAKQKKTTGLDPTLLRNHLVAVR